MNPIVVFVQADKERAERQREYLAQMEREASYDSASEPTSMTNSSTQEGELTIQHEEKRTGEEEEAGEVGAREAPAEEEEEEEEDRTLATTPEGELGDGIAGIKERGQVEERPEFNSNDMMLLRQKLEEVSRSCSWKTAPLDLTISL